MNLHRSIIVASIAVLFAALGCGDDDLRKKGPVDSQNNTSGVNNVNNVNSMSGDNNTNNTGELNNENSLVGLNNQNNSGSNNENNVQNNLNNNSGGLNNENNNGGSNNVQNNLNNNSSGVNNENNVAGDYPSIHVQLTWNTDQTDLDIHLAHPLAAEDTNQPDLDGDGSPDPWLHGTYDCSWRNKNPEWGSAGTHNPLQDLDDLDGFGPENINLGEPEGVDYRIGVRYYSGSSAGDVPPQTVATVKVYIDGDLEYEASRTLSELDMWEVGSVDGRSGTVTPATMNGGPKVTPNYDPDLAF